MRMRMMAQAVTVGFLIGMTVPALAQFPQHPSLAPQLGAVDVVFKEARATGNFSLVVDAMSKVYQDPDFNVRINGLYWIGQNAAALSNEEQDELSLLFVKLNPDRAMSRSVLESVAMHRFCRADLEVRKQFYWEAVREGKATFEGHFSLDRVGALCWAASDGLEEFGPAIDKYADEIDAINKVDPGRESQVALWRLKLRAGGEDREAAVRLQAQRLAKMDDDKLWGLMENDPSFARAVKTGFQEGCERPTSEACTTLAGVVDRQSAHLKELQSRGVDVRSANNMSGMPLWLESGLAKTDAARVELSRRKHEDRQQEAPPPSK